MSEKSQNYPTEEVKFGDESEADLNRTVIVPGLASGAADNTTNISENGGIPDRKRKKEIEDLVGGVDINPYISLDLDVSPELESSLETVGARYAMLTEFAEGGTAKISIARDRNLRRLVAVKSLRMDAENIKELLASFVTEAKVTAQLDHPGIIPIYGLARDEQNGIHLVMKLVNGRTLREYLKNITLNYRIRGVDAFDETVELRKRLEIFLRVCDTLVYAHHRNVIHRDLKPENIMIGKYMEVFVMDWGLAKILSEGEDNFPANRKISGTLRYFPPEVLRGDPLDLRSDIFTLGLILQEVVTLRYAFDGHDEKEIVDRVRKGQIEPVVHLFGRKIDGKLRAIIHKATAYDLKERYQTVEDLAEDLRRYMGGLSISVGDGNFVDKFLRFVFERILKF
ncbi:MAG: serine/threonine protein kinase [Lentisphaeria bacterium]|nr:serine/threonine protein kinase [Lentisphaeria bacterium]